MKKIVFSFLTTIFGSALLAGCSSSPECSGDAVVATVKKIAADAVAKDASLMYVFDAANSRYEVNAIRTIESNDKQCSCKASLHIVFELQDGLKKIRDNKPDAWASMISNNFREAQTKDATLDITYEAERTDDKKNVYVTVHGL